MEKLWEFNIDVGGTFTDCIAYSPKSEIKTCKFLSSGIIKGKLEKINNNVYLDKEKINYPKNFFNRYKLNFLSDNGQIIEENEIIKFDNKTGLFTLKNTIENDNKILNTELLSGEEAPLNCIRYILGLTISDSIQQISVKLGTTKGTNALLERKGERVAFITTKGFKDALEIGTQARPDIFALEINKPKPLYEKVFEINERIDKDGNVLEKINIKEIINVLKTIESQKFESIAICLINSYINPEHENIIFELSKKYNFKNISLSTKVSPLIKFINRGDTTIVDSYLSPVLVNYVNNIYKKIPKSNLKLMTSSGGLLSINNFSGKDSILSGPAGGVNGFTYIAKRAGFEKSIGFDMGGTSTDVSRYDGEFEYQFETEKAGVRIVTPMYAIETVAAGGGSICKFDGQKFVVGPESAGANPGPACYGKGGNLTVTDINLFNGKIDENNFPFKLNSKIVLEHLENISKEVLQKTGKKLSNIEIADGFTKIANYKMASAIKSISSMKGYNPEEYVLVSFGGAGSQHCCSIAEELGINKILINKYSGILSAYGIGVADIKKFSEKTVLKIFDNKNIIELENEFQNLENKLLDEIQDEINQFSKPLITRFYEMRYLKEESTISIKHSTLIKKEFENLHKQLYGHIHTNREIEIVNIRVEVLVPTNKKSNIINNKYENIEKSTNKSKKVFFKGKEYITKVFDRKDLIYGNYLFGPAIVNENFSTIIIDPEWKAVVNEFGDLIISKIKNIVFKEITEIEKDPIKLELFNNIFTNIAYQMGITLQKTALSVNVKERLDFSCAILDKDGELIVNAPHIPVHLGAISESVKKLISNEQNISKGDVFISNTPELGGSHLPDITVITPVFNNNGEKILFFSASRAHHAEIGGLFPGSAYPFAKNLLEEGVIFRNFKVVDKGNFKEDELLKILTNSKYPSRLPDENIADINAQIAANNKGSIELLKVIDSYSWEIVNLYMKYIREAAKEKVINIIKNLEKDEYNFKDYMDDGSPICVKINVLDEKIVIDFSGSGSVNSNSMNAGKAIVQSAITYCLRCLINEPIPLNSGIMEPIQLIIPEGMLNPKFHENPEKCNAVFSGNVEISQRIVDVILGALEIVSASQGTMNNVIFGNKYFGYYETIGGGTGAGKNFNGSDAVHSHMTNTRLTDIEILEKKFPIKVKRFEIRKESGGNGKYKGGNGIIREIEFLDNLNLSLITQRRRIEPFGLNGGNNGKSGKNILFKLKNKNEIILSELEQIEVEKGDILKIFTPGGGGFG